MVLFTYSVKKIKGAAHKNGDIDGTCEQILKGRSMLFTGCIKDIFTIFPCRITLLTNFTRGLDDQIIDITLLTLKFAGYE